MYRTNIGSQKNFAERDPFYLGDEHGRPMANLWYSSTENSPAGSPMPAHNPSRLLDLHALNLTIAAMEAASVSEAGRATPAITVAVATAVPASAMPEVTTLPPEIPMTSPRSPAISISTSVNKTRVSTVVSPGASPAGSPSGSRESLLFTFEEAKAAPIPIPAPAPSSRLKRAAVAFAPAAVAFAPAAATPSAQRFVTSESSRNLASQHQPRSKRVSFAPGI